MSKISEVSFVNLSSTRDLNRKEIYLQREIKEKLIAVKS